MPVQMLSIGMMFAVICHGEVAALFQRARPIARQAALWQLNIGRMFLCALMVVTSIKGNEFSVSVAVCLFYAICFPSGAYVAVRPAKVGLRRIASLFTWPVFGSIIVACGIPLAGILYRKYFPWITFYSRRDQEPENSAPQNSRFTPVRDHVGRDDLSLYSADREAE